MKKNPYSHFYLYSKGWYEKKDTIEDLKAISANCYAIRPEHVRVGEIKAILLDLVWEFFEKSANPGYQFREFLHSLEDWHNWNVIDTCLGFLSIVELQDIENGLAEPDPDILPLAKKSHNSRKAGDDFTYIANQIVK